MTVDFLIVGQGISGTWLSYFLKKEGKRVHMIDDGNPSAPSRVAAGVINPVTGRRLVSSWLIEELIPFVEQHYAALGAALSLEAITKRSIIDFFPSPQIKLAFAERSAEYAAYLEAPDDPGRYDDFFHHGFGWGKITPAYTVHLDRVLPAWRERLVKEGEISTRAFRFDDLVVREDHVVYGDITAEKILFCDGAAGAQLPLFRRLPFSLVKGEALVLRIPGIPDTDIYKKGIMLVPFGEPGLFWAGSNYVWEFADENPTAAFRSHTESILGNWLRVPYTVIDHLSSVRPAAVERRPFVGLHPRFPAVGILNGMGSKGCSLAPYFARQLAQFLVYQEPVMPEADLHRFHKILHKQ